MYKKIISLGMSFLMLFEICTVNTFAKGGDGDFKSVEDRNTEKDIIFTAKAHLKMNAEDLKT